jgi:hypothetical protein
LAGSADACRHGISQFEGEIKLELLPIVFLDLKHRLYRCRSMGNSSDQFLRIPHLRSPEPLAR